MKGSADNVCDIFLAVHRVYRAYNCTGFGGIKKALLAKCFQGFEQVISINNKYIIQYFRGFYNEIFIC